MIRVRHIDTRNRLLPPSPSRGFDPRRQPRGYGEGRIPL